MHIFSPYAAHEPPFHSLWWDMSPSQTLGKGYGERLKDLGISDICVEIDHQTDDEWDSIWGLEALDALVREMFPHKISVSAMAWPQPEPKIIDGLAALAPGLNETGVWALEFDLEGGNWSKSHLKSYISLSAAGIDLVESCRSSAPGLYYGSNFHTGNRQPSVSSRTDYVAVQAYSRYKESDPARHWGAPYGPGNAQRKGWALAQECLSRFTIMGLSAYSQTYPQSKAANTMRVCYEAARDEGAVWFRWWSAKHVVGHRANGYSADFIRGLREQA